MYAESIELINYGPIERLDIEFPFEGELPKPIVFVGENGSGKSILLSHIVNALIIAKDVAYPDTPEVETNKVYKIRSSYYIKHSNDFYFSKVTFQDGFFMNELRTRRRKEEYAAIPSELAGSEAEAMWNQMKDKTNDIVTSSVMTGTTTKEVIKETFEKNCVLYFPFDRYEEPAWLNEENLNAKANRMATSRLQDQTNRRIISYSTLRNNQDWLFDIIYDRAAFELLTHTFKIPGNSEKGVPLFIGYEGEATTTYDLVLQIVQAITRKRDSRFGIGRRGNRVISVESETGQLVPNIFQLSSGETALLDLFLSILRDFDLCGVPFRSQPVQGIVLVDEIDLHLHTSYQYEVLPYLIRMFPHVQFIVTTHSPLFVLGMHNTYGEDGFALYRLPQGQLINPEEFSEFEHAYEAFAFTSKFSHDMQTAVTGSQLPILYMEGKTDIQYLKKAAELLEKDAILAKMRLEEGGGKPGLKNIWTAISKLTDDVLSNKVLLLYDCDYEGASEDQGRRFRRKIPRRENNPIEKGIENLFTENTLKEVMKQRPRLIDVKYAHKIKERGQDTNIPEEWIINGSEKTNLCNWLCENGTRQDFECFELIFDLVEEVLALPS